MSRSRRRPAGGITTATSEKDDKRIWHRRYRHACKQALHVEGEDLELLPHFRSYSNPWCMAKDGKGWYGFAPACRCSLDLTCTCDWWKRIIERMMRK